MLNLMFFERFEGRTGYSTKCTIIRSVAFDCNFMAFIQIGGKLRFQCRLYFS